jgi:hypothetical protein
VSAGLYDKDIGSGDGSHVRMTGGKSSYLTVVFDFSELSQIEHTVSLPGRCYQSFHHFQSFLLALLIASHCCYSGLH